MRTNREDAKAVWARAQELAVQMNLSEREVSIDATGKPDLMRDLKRGSMPGADRLDALAKTLNTTVEFLLGKSPNSAPTGGFPAINFDRLPSDVPVYGTALGANLQVDDRGEVHEVEPTIIEMTDVLDRVKRLPGIMGDSSAYCLTVVGDSMEPRWEDGDPIYVSTTRQPGLGDYVVVQLNNGDTPEIITALVKRLVGRTHQFYEFEQFNPKMRFRISRNRVARLHRIVPPRELYGR